MLDAPLDELLQFPDVPGGTPGHEARSCGLGEPAQVEGRLHLALAGGGGAVAHLHGRRRLSARHAVRGVVEQHAGEVDVAPAGMDQVIAADGRSVSVSGEHDDGELRLGHLDARGDRQSPTMDGMHRVQVV